MEIARPVEEKPEAEADQYSLVPTTTVDQLLASQGLQAVDLCLIDTEGHDHAVLRGAENALRTHSLKIVTFEYGGLWCFRQPNNACIRLEPLIAFLANFASRIRAGGWEMMAMWRALTQHAKMSQLVAGQISGAWRIQASLQRCKN